MWSLGIDHDMAEAFGQGDEVAFGIDDRLLHPGRALLQQAAQQMRFAGAGIALHQQAGRQQFLEVESRGPACRGLPHLDRNSHGSADSPFGGGGLTIGRCTVEHRHGLAGRYARLVAGMFPRNRLKLARRRLSHTVARCSANETAEDQIGASFCESGHVEVFSCSEQQRPETESTALGLMHDLGELRRRRMRGIPRRRRPRR